jgi:hypothetical protein
VTVQGLSLVAGVSRQSRLRREHGNPEFDQTSAVVATSYWPAGVRTTGN